MSPIQAVFEKLETSLTPVAQAIHKGVNMKVLAIGFKKGMIMRDHKTHLPATLTVLSGKVLYRMEEEETRLTSFEQQEIPVNVTHSVEALEDSLCLLTQG